MEESIEQQETELPKEITEVTTEGITFTKEVVVAVNRVAKVVKGGKRLSFNAVVVAGDMQGHVGVAVGKANSVQGAIQKGLLRAKKAAIKVSLKGNTIPHAIIGKCGASKVLLKPASEGTGVIAGSSVRAVVEAAGIKDILSKCLGSTNPINTVYATIDGLSRLRTHEEGEALRKS